MIPGSRRPELLRRAELLARQLAQFRIPGSDQHFDRARLEEVRRYLRSVETTQDLPKFLAKLPASYLRHASRVATPQLQKVADVVGPLAREIDDRDELMYVLAWAARLLPTEPERNDGESGRERGRPGGPPAHRGPPGRGGPPGRR